MVHFTSDASAALGGPDWLKARRARSMERFTAASWPSQAEEVWRYSRIDDLDLERFHPPGHGEAPDSTTGSLPAPLEAILSGVGERSGLVLAVNGRLIHSELHPDLVRQEVMVGSLASGSLTSGPAPVGPAAGPDSTGSFDDVEAPDALGELGEAFCSDPVMISVPDGVEVASPVVLLNWVTGPGVAVFPRTVIELGSSAQADVIEYSASSEDECLVAPAIHMSLGASARLGLVSVQDLGPRSWQIAHQSSRVGSGAQLATFAAAFGGYYARVRTDSHLEGQGASSRLMAAFFGNGDQMHDFRTMQAHDAPRTTSDLLFKGAVKDSAQSVYTGLIRVQKGARGTNAFQTNKNLVLSEGAHADSVPNLDIAENDVRCSHASTVGPIDQDQRYYLQSRGVPPDAADRLIVQGFFDDILAQLPQPALAGGLRRAVSAKLTALAHAPDGSEATSSAAALSGEVNANG